MSDSYYTYLISPDADKNGNECKSSNHDTVEKIGSTYGWFEGYEIDKSISINQQKLLAIIQEKAIERIASLYRTKTAEKICGDLRDSHKVLLIGLKLDSKEDFINISRICRCPYLEKARWVFLKKDMVVHQSISCIILPGSGEHFSFGDILDIRIPADVSWGVRESLRWNGANSFYLSISCPSLSIHKKLSKEIELCNKLSYGDTEAEDNRFWKDYFRGIIISGKDSYSVIKHDGEVFVEIPITSNIYETDTPESIATKKESDIVHVVDYENDSTKISTLISIDSENRVTGVANIPNIPFMSITTGARASLIERFMFSSSSNKCVIVYGKDAGVEFGIEVERLVRRGIFSAAYVDME